MSWRNAAPAKNVSEEGEDPGCSLYPTQDPVPQGFGPAAPPAAARGVGVPRHSVSTVLWDLWWSHLSLF